jgi:hypothetical protein
VYTTPGFGTPAAQWAVDENEGSPDDLFWPRAKPDQSIGPITGSDPYDLFGDNPQVTFYAQGDTPYFGYQVKMNEQFMTDLLWCPDNGYPIVVASQPWQVQAQGQRALWVGSATCRACAPAGFSGYLSPCDSAHGARRSHDARPSAPLPG